MVIDGDGHLLETATPAGFNLRELHRLTFSSLCGMSLSFLPPGLVQPEHALALKFHTAEDRHEMVRTVTSLLKDTHCCHVGHLYFKLKKGTQNYTVTQHAPVDLSCVGFSLSGECAIDGEQRSSCLSQVGRNVTALSRGQSNDEHRSNLDISKVQEELRIVKEQVQPQQSHIASLVVALITGSKPPPPGTDTDPWDYLKDFDLGPEEMAELNTHDDFKNAADARLKRSSKPLKINKNIGEVVGTGGGIAVDRADSPEETSAAIAAFKELGWMACAPAVQELIKQMPNAGWAEMRQVKEVLLQEPEAGQDFVVLMQYL